MNEEHLSREEAAEMLKQLFEEQDDSWRDELDEP